MKVKTLRDQWLEKKNYDYSEDYSDDEEKDEDNSYRSEYDRKDIIKVHDFINKSPYTKDNLIPDEKGEIILKDIDLDEYSFIHILCFIFRLHAARQWDSACWLSGPVPIRR